VSFAIHTICDASVAKAETKRHSPRHPKLVLTTTILASSLAFIDGSVVNVGLPAISTTFHAGAEDLQWVVNAYLLPLSALLLLGGGAGDHFGRVRLLVVGTLVFGMASVGCAIAPEIVVADSCGCGCACACALARATVAAQRSRACSYAAPRSGLLGTGMSPDKAGGV